MSGHSQPGVKRQKMREARPADHVDYFQGIDKIEYNNMASPNETSCFRYYSGTERVHSRPMEEWLKFSVSLTEFRNHGIDYYGKQHRSWDDGTNTVDNHKRCIKALFDFCVKLNVKYWTALDSDLVPASESWEETKAYWDEVVEYIQELGQRCHVKLLWIAPDLHSHPRYASGAFTSNDASTFAQAATQIKKCLEVSQRLNAECFLFWPHREGYENIFETDVAREIKLFAKLLKITTEYKDRLNYKCQLLIMPYYSCQRINYNSNLAWQHRCESDVLYKYMWDVTSCLYLLKNYNLDRYYKVCTPPGHQMFMANVYNMLGGVALVNREDQYNTKKFTFMMKCILEQGTAPPGGLNLRLLPRRGSDLHELATLYVKYMDATAKGLRFAASLISEQTFSKHLQQHYLSYCSGFGSRLLSSDVTIEECEDYYKKNQHSESASKAEHLDLMFQRYLDTSDHI